MVPLDVAVGAVVTAALLGAVVMYGVQETQRKNAAYDNPQNTIQCITAQLRQHVEHPDASPIDCARFGA